MEEATKFFDLENNGQWAAKKVDYEPISKFNYFFKDKTNKFLENNEFPLFTNDDNIVDTTVPVVHHMNGPKLETGVLYLFLREQQQSLGAATPEFVTTDTIEKAQLMGVDVKLKTGEKPVFYPSSSKDAVGNQATKNIYYVNLSQLDNPEGIMEFIKKEYQKSQHEKNVTNKAKFESGEYEKFFEANENYPNFKTVNSKNTIEPFIPSELAKKYQALEEAKNTKPIDIEVYKKQSSELKKSMAAFMLGSMVKAGLSGVCVKMMKGDVQLFKEGLQTVTKDNKAWLTKFCKNAQTIAKNLTDIEIKDKSQTNSQEKVQAAPAPKPSKPDMGFDRDLF